MEPPPVTARYVARAQLGGALLAVVIGVIGGLLMQLELAAPGAKWSADFYSRSLSLHGLTPLAVGATPFAGVLGYLAVMQLVGAKRVPAPVLAWVAFGVWVIGLAITIGTALTIGNDTGWTFYTPHTIEEPLSTRIFKLAFPLTVSGSALIYAAHLAIVIAANRTVDGIRLAIASALVVAIGGAGLVGASAAFTTLGVSLATMTTMVAMMFAAIALGGERRTQLILMAIGLGLAVVWAVWPMIVVALALAGIWIALAIVGGFGRPAVAFVVFGCAPAVVMRGLASGLSSDLHLHDTYFEVGTLHLNAAALGFAALAGVHALPLVARIPNKVLAWIGACVCSGGLLLHIYAQLGVGSSGMPRRYWDYDPQYQAGHLLAIAGTVVLLVGAVMVVVAWLVGRPPRLASD